MILRILFFLVSSANALIGQNAGEYFFVRDSIALLMAKPDGESEIIIQVSQGDLLFILERTSIEVVNEYGHSYWYQVRFEKNVGYISGMHCSNVSVKHNSIDTFDILYGNYEELDYNPGLHWYAIISTDHGDKVKKVNITPTLEIHADNHEVISPFKSETADLLFLIGTDELLDTSIVGVKSFLPEIWLKPWTEINLILYDKINGFSTGQKLMPAWRHLKSNDSKRDSFTDYRLIYHNDRLEAGVALYKPQVNWFNQIPNLIWYGDLDHDQLPEFLFFTNGDNRGYDIEFIKVVYIDGIMQSLKLVSKRPGWPSSC